MMVTLFVKQVFITKIFIGTMVFLFIREFQNFSHTMS